MTTDQIKAQIVRELELPADAAKLLDAVVASQQEINAVTARLDTLITDRRAGVLGLNGTYRVTKYRLAQVLGVSQTTVGNITRSRPELRRSPRTRKP